MIQSDISGLNNTHLNNSDCFQDTSFVIFEMFHLRAYHAVLAHFSPVLVFESNLSNFNL